MSAVVVPAHTIQVTPAIQHQIVQLPATIDMTVVDLLIPWVVAVVRARCMDQ